MSELTNRRADISDSRDLFEWRNDLHSREASTNSGLVSWEDHENWFSTKLESKDTYIFVFELDSTGTQKAGMTRFDLDRELGSAEVSINLNPKYRGHGLAGKMLAKSLTHFFAVEEGINVITASIRGSNVASTKIFVRAGFREDSAGEDFVHYSLVRN